MSKKFILIPGDKIPPEMPLLPTLVSFSVQVYNSDACTLFNYNQFSIILLCK